MSKRRPGKEPVRAVPARSVIPDAPPRAAAWVWVAPALAVLALYARTLGYAFVWDDLDLIVRNAALQGPAWVQTLGQDFWSATGGGTGMWRPLVTLSYRVDGVLSHWQPWLFHAVNVLAYAAAAALVARLALARRIPPVLAFGAGLVFATAPAASEAVAWVAGRTDSFAALFTLGALLLAREARDRGLDAHRQAGLPSALPLARGARERDRRALAAGSLACVTLALLAKESAFVLPLLLAADAVDEVAEPAPRVRREWDAGHAGRAWRAWRALWPATIVVLAWALAHRALVPGSSRPSDPGAAGGMAALVWAHLAWLVPWAPHAPLLELWRPPALPIAALAWAALAALAGLAALLARRRRPLLLPLALLVLPLLPVAAASLLESGVRFAERALVLPAAGLGLALAWLAARAAPRHATAAAAALAAWTSLQLACALAPIAAWANEESRIRRIATVRPRDLDALLGLADLLSSEGREREAVAWIERAEVVAPEDAGPAIARASLAFRAGRNDEALVFAARACAREPANLAAGIIRVRALARLGRAREAVAAADSLVASHPGEPAALGAQGVARFAAGDAAGAVAPLAAASARLLDDLGLAWDLGRAAIAVGDVSLARAAFERAVAAAPDSYDAWLGVADTRSRLGDRAGAEAALARAASLPGARDGRADTLRARIAERR